MQMHDHISMAMEDRKLPLSIQEHIAGLCIQEQEKGVIGMEFKMEGPIDFIKWFLVAGVGLLIIMKLLMLLVRSLLGQSFEGFVPLGMLVAIGLGCLYWLMIAGPGLASRD